MSLESCKQIQDLTVHKAEKLPETFLLTCVVLYNMLRTNQGRQYKAPTQPDDIAALQNEQVVYVPDENYRKPLREAKHQQVLLKDYFSHVGALAGQEDRV